MSAGRKYSVVMPGLDPGVHELAAAEKEDVDGRGRPCHDGGSKR